MRAPYDAASADADESSSDEDKPFECLVCLQDVRLHEGVFAKMCLHAFAAQWLLFMTSHI